MVRQALLGLFTLPFPLPPSGVRRFGELILASDSIFLLRSPVPGEEVKIVHLELAGPGMISSNGTWWLSVIEIRFWMQGSAGLEDVWLGMCVKSLTTGIKLSSCEV